MNVARLGAKKAEDKLSILARERTWREAGNPDIGES